MALLLANGITGCSYIPFIGKKKPQETIVKKLWTSGEQFVAIEKQDRRQGVSVNPNQHITEISVERVRDMLESMELRSSGDDKNMPLFNEEEIKILSEYLPVGLALAGPDEDVTFAVIGHYVESMGFLKKREVTTGRVFYQAGRINIIFGDVHRELQETMGKPEDRRVFPFLPGSRAGAVGVMDGSILPKPGGEIFAKNRQDWVAFQLNSGEGEAMSQTDQESEVESPPLHRSNTGTLSPAPHELASSPAPKYTAPPAEQSNTPAATTPRYTAPPVAPRYTGAVRDNRTNAQGYQATQPVAKKGIEERLTILNNLRNKRLITEEEYRQKRMDILSEL